MVLLTILKTQTIPKSLFNMARKTVLVKAYYHVMVTPDNKFYVGQQKNLKQKKGTPEIEAVVVDKHLADVFNVFYDRIHPQEKQ